jgi:hypothetical protein
MYSQLKLGVETLTGTQVLTSKRSLGSAIKGQSGEYVLFFEGGVKICPLTPTFVI